MKLLENTSREREREISVIEIGTFKGENALNILQKLNVKRIYIIDPYEEYESYKKDASSKDISKIEKIARRKLRKFSNKIVWIKKFSDVAVRDIKEKVDFIYVDGNHDYEYVKKDMNNYWRLLKEGGMMAGHDICYPSVAKAFCEFVNNQKLEPHIWNMDWWVFKPISRKT